MPAPAQQTRVTGFWSAAVTVCCAATFLSNLTVAYQAGATGPGARVRDTGFVRVLREGGLATRQAVGSPRLAPGQIRHRVHIPLRINGTSDSPGIIPAR